MTFDNLFALLIGSSVGTVLGCISGSIICAIKEYKIGVRERVVTIYDCGINDKGERIVELWSDKRSLVPWLSETQVLVKFPSYHAYEIVKTFGPTRFVAEYIRKPYGLGTIDEYINLREFSNAEYL